MTTTEVTEESKADIEGMVERGEDSKADIRGIAEGAGESKADIEGTTEAMEDSKARIQFNAEVTEESKADIEGITEGTGESKASIVWVQSTITGVEPDVASEGEYVAITGTHFGAVQGVGYVEVYGGRVEIVSWSDTEIVFVTPAFEVV